MTVEEEAKEKYAQANAERQRHVDAIVASRAAKKVVVAGPGTGKTFLFRKLLAGKEHALALTFVNALVEDLALELCGMADVKTLHAFAREILAKTGREAKIYPKLSAVIAEDVKALLGQDVDFDAIFHNRDDKNELIGFYKERKKYYGYYGYSDIVYAAVLLFETKSETIPSYDQVVVDEFQDFNKLEVSLIEKLAEKSPVLLAGDDDQALYAFKKASTDYIRERHGNTKHGYAAFNLPFCSRSTRVVVGAVNDIIRAAEASGRLKGRIPKPYIYFENEDKDRDSAAFPKITLCGTRSRMVPWLIQRELRKLARELRTKFTVLVISPTRVQSRIIAGTLARHGLKGVDFVDRHDSKSPELLEGLKLLLLDDKCNLAWRIVARCLLSPEAFAAVLSKMNGAGAVAAFDVVDKDLKKRVRKMLTTIRAIQNGRTATEEGLMALLAALGRNLTEASRALLGEEIADEPNRPWNAPLKGIPVTCTTIQSSKGRAADFVFVTHFDDQFFIRDGSAISDEDICNLLVAFTRARKKLYLISTSNGRIPIFSSWIARERLDELGWQLPESDRE